MEAENRLFAKVSLSKKSHGQIVCAESYIR